VSSGIAALRYTKAKDWCAPVSGIVYRTLVPVVWHIGHARSPYRVIVPAGRRFDVSIPRPFRLIFKPHDPRYLKAAVLHDEMLHHLGFSRLTAGAEFEQALRADGVPVLERLLMWQAVSLFKYGRDRPR
jgi:hypothetical protein